MIGSVHQVEWLPTFNLELKHVIVRSHNNSDGKRQRQQTQPTGSVLREFDVNDETEHRQ